MRTVVKKVTPEEAKRMLQSVPDFQRKVSQTWVFALKSRMDKGYFTVMPSQICFDVLGQLINGQHTLHAVALHGKPVELSVTYDMPTECFAHFDQGKRRSNADVLGIPRKRLEIASTIRRLVDANDGSPESVKTTYDIFEPYISSFFDKFNGNNRQGFTSKVRTGAVLAIVAGSDSSEVCDLYWKMQTDRIADLPPACVLLWKRIISKTMKSENVSDRDAEVILTFKALNKPTRGLEKLFVSNSDKGRLLDIVCQLDSSLIQAKQDSKAAVRAYFKDANNLNSSCETGAASPTTN